MKRYNPKEIEPKWQKAWAESKIYQATEDSAKPKRYVLEYFPYPSGAAMHVGHVRNYTIGDSISRFNRMRGHNVLHPMGWDAFGLPAENYAIKTGISPQQTIKESTEKFKQQLTQMGFDYDWSREINSSDPAYYKWTQWLFLLLYKKGLAYRKESLQWWCPVDKTVLANEQVEDGKCWRCGSVVEKKALPQWFFKITDYADRLIKDLDDVDWSNSIKTQQKNWIGKSTGAEIDFELESSDKTNYVILHGFGGRTDTNFLPWLKQSLEGKGHKVQVPQMPNTDNPKEHEQVEYVLKNCTFNENTVLIGHSLGGVVAMKVLEKLDIKIKELFLIAPAIEPKFGGKKKRIFWDNFDFNYDYKKISKQSKKILILSDNKEAEYRGKYLDYLSKQLQCQLQKVDATKKHFIAEIEPIILDVLKPRLRVFTTRHDTLYGVTFMVLAPEHPLVREITTAEYKDKVEQYIANSIAKSDLERQQEEKQKTGQFTGAYVINPANEEKIQVWIADYVLWGYGTGAVMGVPGHDERDNEFAKKYDLPIKKVLKTDNDTDFHSEGLVVNSDKYDGMRSEKMREQILSDLVKDGGAEEKINYKIRDWLISRQRYWGAPIPIIHCTKDGIVPVPEADLPVLLPEMKSYEPSGDGRSPLANVEEFVKTKCPKCGEEAERETDTMDGFACSSWYFLRFADPHNDKNPFDTKKAKFWLPVDDYIGGAEHAVMHLLYARFWTKVMYDEGLIEFKEPFTSLRNQGMILAPDGHKMSKSKGNTIEPGELISQGYGADSIRLMELFIGPWNQSASWSTEGIGGTFRFLQRIWTLTQEFIESADKDSHKSNEQLLKVSNQAIRKVSSDLHEMGFNTAIAALMEATNQLYKIKARKGFVDKKDWNFALTTMIQLLAPFAPHITEELWKDLGYEDSVHTSEWPLHDEKYLISDTMTIVVQVNGKVRANINMPADSSEEEIIKVAKADEKVQEYLNKKELRKTIYVPQKLINFVV
ncbi:MAG TPA: leucine--tRNA ligase [Patescibacteria group bacterium]|nr:leucine--tRNA ligase [Patescibacteria group bacterium]